MSTEAPEGQETPLYGLVRFDGDNAEGMVDMLASCQATGIGVIYCPDHEVGVLVFHAAKHQRPHTRTEQRTEVQCLHNSFRSLLADFPIDPAHFEEVSLPPGLKAFLDDLLSGATKPDIPGTPNPN